MQVARSILESRKIKIHGVRLIGQSFLNASCGDEIQ